MQRVYMIPLFRHAFCTAPFHSLSQLLDVSGISALGGKRKKSAVLPQKRVSLFLLFWHWGVALGSDYSFTPTRCSWDSVTVDRFPILSTGSRLRALLSDMRSLPVGRFVDVICVCVCVCLKMMLLLFNDAYDKKTTTNKVCVCALGFCVPFYYAVFIFQLLFLYSKRNSYEQCGFSGCVLLFSFFRFSLNVLLVFWCGKHWIVWISA